MKLLFLSPLSPMFLICCVASGVVVTPGTKCANVTSFGEGVPEDVQRKIVSTAINRINDLQDQDYSIRTYYFDVDGDHRFTIFRSPTPCSRQCNNTTTPSPTIPQDQRILELQKELAATKREMEEARKEIEELKILSSSKIRSTSSCEAVRQQLTQEKERKKTLNDLNTVLLDIVKLRTLTFKPPLGQPVSGRRRAGATPMTGSQPEAHKCRDSERISSQSAKGFHDARLVQPSVPGHVSGARLVQPSVQGHVSGARLVQPSVQGHVSGARLVQPSVPGHVRPGSRPTGNLSEFPRTQEVLCFLLHWLVIMLFRFLVLAAICFSPSIQDSTYKLLKEYGELKLNQACYGEKAFRIWNYNYNDAKNRCEAKGFSTKKDDYLTFSPASKIEKPTKKAISDNSPQFINPNKFFVVDPPHDPSIYYPAFAYQAQPRPADQLDLPFDVEAVNKYVAKLQQAFRQQNGMQTPSNPYVRRPQHDYSFFGALTGAYATPSVSGKSDKQSTSYKSHYNPYAPFLRAPEAVSSYSSFDPAYYKSLAYKPNSYYSSAAAPSVGSYYQTRIKRDTSMIPTDQELLKFEEQQLERAAQRTIEEMRGMACVMKEMGYMKDNDEVDVEFKIKEIRALDIDESLKDNLVELAQGCYDLTRHIPDSLLKLYPVSTQLARSMKFFKCCKKAATKVCIKHEFQRRV
ncbi:unnamed protein product [Cyprideis torosa]|uniref:Uncharacterized protein n=1 Tax=Cyprideis torosa TaxID=163714 RepID=A0A7R8WDT8_9CRUS|nr:unnamed protein product [Cyprideis torosa]CAG0888709.1 unnamed protein product [Cyprideis torosa]